MPNTNRFKFHYRSLANHLQALELDATCADLVACLATFQAHDPDFWAGCVEQIRALPPETDWMTGLDRLWELLEQQNPRFLSSLMMEWVLENA